MQTNAVFFTIFLYYIKVCSATYLYDHHLADLEEHVRRAKEMFDTCHRNDRMKQILFIGADRKYRDAELKHQDVKRELEIAENTLQRLSKDASECERESCQRAFYEAKNRRYESLSNLRACKSTFEGARRHYEESSTNLEAARKTLFSVESQLQSYKASTKNKKY